MEDRTSVQAAALTPSGNLHRPMTDARKALFIKALRETGVFVAAARVASPHSEDGSNKGAASSFRYTMSVDPEFAAAVAEAKEEADASLEMECWRRAYKGVKTPVFQKGTQATDVDGNPAFIVNYSDRLLERLLESRMPERWTTGKKGRRDVGLRGA